MKTQSQNRAPTLRLRLTLTAVIEEDGKAFHAFCPGLKGLHVDGATPEEALENATQAAHCYIDSLIRHGDPLPIGPHFTAEKMEEVPPIPMGALLRHIELECAIQGTSGDS